MASSSTTFNKNQILEMIHNKNSAIAFDKAKHAKSFKWNNYLQIYVNGFPPHFITYINCHCVLAWKPHDDTNIMGRHDKSM